MHNSHTKYSFSHTLLFVVLLGYCANYISGAWANQFLSLIPERIFNNFEFWRLLTFPFAVPRLENILLFSFSFYFIAPKIELLFRGKLFPLLLGLLTILQGIILSLVFRDSSIVFSGGEGISFFMIFLFAALSFSTKSLPNWFKPGKIGGLSLLVGIMWISILMFQNSAFGNSVIISSASNAIFGIFFSIIIYFKIRTDIIKQRRLQTKEINDLIPIIIPTPEELKYAMMGESRKKQFNSYEEDTYSKYSEKFNPDEDKLNEILDKILDYGKESLTISENKYLEDYSNSMKS